MSKQFAGNAVAVAAYLIWGALPLYWGLLDGVPPILVLAYRVLFSLILLSVILLFSRWRTAVKDVLKSGRRTLMALAASGLIFANWALYIWGLAQGLHIDVSFGYYLCPLVQVVLGALFLKEKMQPATIAAFVLAVGAVAYLMLSGGVFPWFAVSLAATFAVYGLVKKKVDTDAYTGLLLETAFSAPLAAGILVFYGFNGGIVFGQEWGTSLLLVGAGLVTATPLALFGEAARRIPLTSLGFFQYISPSIMLLVGVFVYGKPVTQAEWVAFIVIWIALVVYSVGAVLRQKKAAVRPAAPCEDTPV